MTFKRTINPFTDPSSLKDKTEYKTKNKNRIYRINSINEKLLTNIYSFNKSNSTNKNPQVKKRTINISRNIHQI